MMENSKIMFRHINERVASGVVTPFEVNAGWVISIAILYSNGALEDLEWEQAQRDGIFN